MRYGDPRLLLVLIPVAAACAQQVDDGTSGKDRASGGTSASTSSGNSPNSTSTRNESTGGTTASSTTSSSNSDSNCVADCGPDYESFYDNDKLASIRITIAQQDLGSGSSSNWLDVLWNRWAHCEPYNPIRVGFEYDSPDDVGDVKLSEVGMRLRGSMKRGTNALQGFKLDFQKPFYAQTATSSARRRFGDINRLNTLSLEPARNTNTPPDVTHMVPCLAFKFLRDFEIPAPRCNHLQVYVQDAYYGLMENVEEADHGHFLMHHFGTSEGLLIEASPSGCGFNDSQADLGYHGAKFSDYTSPPRYNIERGTEADAEASLFPMFQCADAAQTPDDQQFATCIQEWLNVDEWLRLVAAESVMPELESLGYVRNFYLYFHPDPQAPHGGRFVIYTWDLDTAFLYQACKPTNCDLFTAVSSSFSSGRLPLIQRLMRVFKSDYCARLKDFTDNVFNPSVVENMATVMNPGMVSDPTHTENQWVNEVMRLRDWVQSHKQSSQSAIQSACSGT